MVSIIQNQAVRWEPSMKSNWMASATQMPVVLCQTFRTRSDINCAWREKIHLVSWTRVRDALSLTTPKEQRTWNGFLVNPTIVLAGTGAGCSRLDQFGFYSTRGVSGERREIYEHSYISTSCWHKHSIEALAAPFHDRPDAEATYCVKDLTRKKENQKASNRQCSHLKESYICAFLVNQTWRTPDLADCSGSDCCKLCDLTGYIRFTWTFGVAQKNSAKAALVRHDPRLHQVQIARREAVYTHTSKADAIIATLGHDPNRVSVRTLDMEAEDEFIEDTAGWAEAQRNYLRVRCNGS